MDKVNVKLTTQSECKLSFQYSNSDTNFNRYLNFSRNCNENIGNLRTKIANSIDHGPNEDGNRFVTILLNGKEVDDSITCDDLFQMNDCEKIVINVSGKEYRVVVNSPWIYLISLQESILTNFANYPPKFDKSHYPIDKTEWVLAGEQFPYTPIDDDVNFYLKLTCNPRNENLDEGTMVKSKWENRIKDVAKLCPFVGRHEFTKSKTKGKEFRVVSYNILADFYCELHQKNNVNKFPYCPHEALNIQYRTSLIQAELAGYNADLICLQEVDQKVYKSYHEPFFSALSYGSTFRQKGIDGQITEGLAAFYNTNRFRLIETNYIVLGQYVKRDPIFADIWAKISKDQKLSNTLEQLSTVLQTVVLECLEEDKILLVANTHLYAKPTACLIRLLQGGLALRYVNHIEEKLKQKTSKSVGVVFCGDFNSLPESGVYSLFTERKGSEKDETGKEINIEHSLPLGSACGTPLYTNFVDSFVGCLDYIFYETSTFEVAQIVPFPNYEEVIKNTALPSEVFPSDHIALVCDLKWS